MKFLEKIRNEKNIPIIIFLILFINYLPLFINNIQTKKNIGVTIGQMTVCFAIEIILLIIYLFKRVKFEKNIKINSILLAITTAILAIIQIKNYATVKYEVLDFINVACIGINILFLFVAFLNLKIEEKYIYSFFVGMVALGMVACAVNVVMYRKEIITLITTAKFLSIKSFFAHRNQFAIFLFATIISNIMLLLRSNKKTYKIILTITLIILGINLILTASRTGILSTLIFIGLLFITTDRIKIKSKIIIITILAVLGILGLIIILNYFPTIVEIAQNVLIRKSTIKTFTGRATFWKIGADILTQNPINFFFGVGRFLAVELISKYDVTQFHNFYMEALMAGGIMELIYFMYIYIYVAIKIMKSNLEKKYKSLYISMYISYAIYAMAESLSRFSIGCADAICLIFFITIPLLHANSVNLNKPNIKELDEANLDECKGENE